MYIYIYIYTYTYTYIHSSNSVTSGSGICTTNIYHNDCYLHLQLFVFKFQMKNE